MTAFCGLTIQLLNSVLFIIEIPYWFGYIFNTLGIFLTTYLLIWGECVQGCWYNEVYEHQFAIGIQSKKITPGLSGNKDYMKNSIRNSTNIIDIDSEK